MWAKVNVQDYLELTKPFNFKKCQINPKHPFQGFIFFDAGSVLLDLDWDSFYDNVEKLLLNKNQFNRKEFFTNLQTTKLMPRWCSGEIGPSAFAKEFLELLNGKQENNQINLELMLKLKDYHSRIVGSVRLRVKRLMKTLKQNHFGIGLLSNCSPWHEVDISRTINIDDICDLVLFSQDLGFEKPAAEIYALSEQAAIQCVKQKYGTDLLKESIYFVDDTPVNVRAAINCGWNSRLVCLLKNEVISAWTENKISAEEFANASVSKQNLVFGDKAALRVEELFANLIEEK